MEIKKICAICGREFVADRKNKKYCSPECYRNKQLEDKHVAWLKKKAKLRADRSSGPKPDGDNEYGHDDCYYRSSSAVRGFSTCDYIIRTGEPRGCKPSACDKYKPKGAKK